MVLLLALACTGDSADDTAEVVDTADSGAADTDTDTDTGVEDDHCDLNDDATAPSTAVVTGTVVAYDGGGLEGLEVQICQDVCIQAWTDAAGAFRFEDLAPGCYKIDALGERVEGRDYGRIRAYVGVEAGATVDLAAPLYLPKVYGPQAVTSGTYTFGDVEWTVDASTLSVPFGYEDGEYWAGVVPGAEVPALWDAQPVAAVAFLPLETAVSAPFDVAVNGAFEDGTLQVWSVDAKGKLEGPVGTATVSGGRIVAQGVQPTLLTWLLFTP